APSKDFSSDYHRAVDGSKSYPLWIKPDEKIALSDVFDLMRDHYEGTEFDLTNGVDAGPYGSPYRWRPLSWMVDSVEYSWERAISTQQTAFSFVSQSRDWLPDGVGGVFWYGLDDTYFTCYFPLYCSINKLPLPYTVGSLQEFSWESAWWVFNFVSNFAQLKYSFMINDIKEVQSELEMQLISLQPTIEKTALELNKKNKDLMIEYLTDYSVTHAEIVNDRWRSLGEYLIMKYNDGYVKNEEGRPADKGYPEDWSRKVLKEREKQCRLPVKDQSVPERRLVD
ncbi:MAG: hypothetical protein GY855_05505, partial [candidate division Zixibacteria bacterium]|nr:hypothetical protein [candidate division Zixibacteria bacterium]